VVIRNIKQVGSMFQVGAPEIRQYKAMPDGRQMSFIPLSMTIYPTHYHNGQLVLKCTAHVSTIYRQTT